MTTKAYPLGVRKVLEAGINFDTDTIKVVAVDLNDYTYSDTHDALNDIPAGARVATGTLTNTDTATTAGVFDADDLVLTSVTGDQFEALVIYKDSGVESTSWLFGFIDSATGFPATPNGTNITITWDSGASKIFAAATP
jgi:hypothetical protein